MTSTSNRYQVSIEADPNLPIIRMTRDFDATPAQLMRAHTDPELFARWVGPNDLNTKILDWDATTGGRWRYDRAEFVAAGSAFGAFVTSSDTDRRAKRPCARLSVNGKGSLEPRYRPESDPENRSRNRRVEIIHVRGS